VTCVTLSLEQSRLKNSTFLVDFLFLPVPYKILYYFLLRYSQLQAHRQTLERLTRRPAGGGSAGTAASASVVAPPQQTSANAGGQPAVPSQGHATAASGGSSAAGNSNQCKENNRSGAGFLLPTLGMVTTTVSVSRCWNGGLTLQILVI
jgi:hypothetical protein